MAEWLKAHAWKACLGYPPNVGSNPTPSAIIFSQYDDFIADVRSSGFPGKELGIMAPDGLVAEFLESVSNKVQGGSDSISAAKPSRMERMSSRPNSSVFSSGSKPRIKVSILFLFRRQAHVSILN
jgi:hypothetical protein